MAGIKRRATPRLGPSDSSDSASDRPNEAPADSDAAMTGERASAAQLRSRREHSEIGADRVVGPEEAGLGSGLDQAEEARLGITDEELKKERDR